MDKICQAAIAKKSFELNYNGGTIWCEHLDGIGDYEYEVIQKFEKDKASFLRPSVSSSMIINLDRTEITAAIVETISNILTESKKKFRKVAFVGVDTYWHRELTRILGDGRLINFFWDYERAKEWVL